MVTAQAPSLVKAICNWLARTATAYHLWCAECELRLAETDAMSPASRKARSRNLDLLRDYRRRGEFPRNRHDPNRNAPCFIDAESRQCAVARLMFASGDEATALNVAENANFARVRQMQLPELDTWAGESGLTKSELARIQPGYAPTPEQLNYAFDFLYAIWLVGSLAAVSILVNSFQLVSAFAHRFGTSLVGIITGVMLLGLGLHVDLNRLNETSLFGEAEILRWLAVGMAWVAIAVAVIPFFFSGREFEPRSPRKPADFLPTAISAIPIVSRPSEHESTVAKPKGRRAVGEFVAAIVLSIAFLTGPALVFLKVIGPGTESRFNQVHQHGHDGVVMGVAFSGDGSRIVTAADDGTAILWDAATGKRLQTFRGHSDGITCVAISSDGEHIVTGSMDKTAMLWRASSGNKVRTFRGHGFWIDSVALSRDGKSVLTGSHDKTAILWDSATGEKRQTFEGHGLVVTSVALNADATRVLTGSYDKTAILWDAATGTKIQTFGDHNDFVSSVALSGDGKAVATGSWDKTAALWDAVTGKKVQTFRGHLHRVQAVAISDDAKFVVTGSTDNSAVLWNAVTGESLQPFHRHIRPITCVAITNDGKQVVTGSGDFTAILWDAETGAKRHSFGNSP